MNIEKFKTKIESEELKRIYLDIMIKFSTICDENNISYWLYAGTLLGSIREKSFIDWDDDIDILMPRESYEAFIDYCIIHEKELYPYKIIHYRNTTTTTPIARFHDMRYKRIFMKKIDECDQGVPITLFPIDGGGNSLKECKKIMNRQKFLQNILGISRFNVFIKPENKLLIIPKLIIYKILRTINAQRLVVLVDNYSKKHSYKESYYLTKSIWGKMVYFTKDELGTEEGVFEGIKFKIPSGYDSILKRMYGDYMVPPPIEERISTHFVEYYKR